MSIFAGAMKICLILFCVLLPAQVFAQRQYSPDQPAYAWAKTGLTLRQGPRKNSGKITTIPYKAEVKILETIGTGSFTDTLVKNPTPLVIQGKWLKVRYNETTGYVFDGYISHIKPQQLSTLFAGIIPIRHDTVFMIEGVKYESHSELYTRNDGGYYEYTAMDGCFDHVYFIPGISFEEAVMLLSGEYSEAPGCIFSLLKANQSEYIFSDCEAITFCSITKTSKGFIITTTDCT